MVVVMVGHKVPRVVPEDPVVVVDHLRVLVQVVPQPRDKVSRVVLERRHPGVRVVGVLEPWVLTQKVVVTMKVVMVV